MNNDKFELLDEVKEVISREKKLDIVFFLSTVGIMMLVFLTLFPKVYLNSQIYYKSRYIKTLEYEREALKEENVAIKTKVESIKFKNQILDTLF